MISSPDQDSELIQGASANLYCSRQFQTRDFFRKESHLRVENRWLNSTSKVKSNQEGRKKMKKISVQHEGRIEEKQRTRTNGIDDRHLIRG